MRAPQTLSADDQSSISILRGIGWAMFVLSFVDLLIVLVPPQLLNPTWEFQAAGALMERIPVPLIGLGLIFLGKSTLRKVWEKFFLRYLSWGTLFAGVLLCIILIPVVLINSYTRLSAQMDTQYNDQFRSQVAQSTEIREKVDQAKPEELNILLQQQGARLTAASPKKLKEQLLQSLGEAQNKAKTVLIAEKNQRLMVIRKNTFKWTLTSVISGITMIFLWHWSAWAR